MGGVCGVRVLPRPQAVVVLKMGSSRFQAKSVTHLF